MSSLWATVKGVGRLFKVIVVLIATFLGTVFAIAILAYFYFARDLPNLQTVSDYHPQLVSKVYGSDGTQIGEFWMDERRHLIKIQEVPPLIISAFIAAEDSRFLEHRGVDFRSIIRALIANWKAGSIVQGGSTITQQVTRSLLLTRTQSYERKIKEAILANRLERYLTKDQILYLYLNQIYFGNRAYGIVAATENYFHKKLEELSLAEISLLAAMPRAPNLYSPFKYPERVRERQQYVLNRLVGEKVITPQEKENALKERLKIHTQGTDKDSNLAYAPHFTETIRQELLKKYGEDKLYYGGLKIFTPIDPKMQLAAIQALRRGLEVVDRRRGGWRGPMEHVEPLLLTDKKEELHKQVLAKQAEEFIFYPPQPDTLDAKTPVEPNKIYPAIVTGFNGNGTEIAIGRTEGVVPTQDIHYDPEKLSYIEGLYIYHPRSQLKIGDVIKVRKNEGDSYSFYQEPLIQGAIYSQEPGTGLVKAIVGGYDFQTSEFNRAMAALRQPGSAFKPFVYAAALDKGYQYNSQILDSPFAIPVGDEIWAPKNYSGSYRGVTTVHDAIVHSYNVATARVAYHIGFDYLTAYQRKMGITTPIMKYPSMALGANGVHLMEMVAAYSTFPNLGVYRKPVFITKITDQEGHVLEEYKPEEEELFGKAATEKQMESIANNEELNRDLYEKNLGATKEDHLDLSPSELKVLYGNNIPPGHVMTPQTAYLMVRLMSDVVKMGTGQRVLKLKRTAAGKTGTTNDETDTWFIGYVPQLAAGVWVGYDAVRPIGRGEQGGRTAAPIFLDFMQTATEEMEVAEFTKPEDFEEDNLYTMSGGSAIHAEITPVPALGGLYGEGGSSQDRSADFLEADFEGLSW